MVSLPAGVFKPYSGVKTSILLLDKKLARRTGKILFLKIAADGFDLGDKRSPIEANDLPEAERIVKAWFNGKLVALTESSVAWKTVSKKELLQERHAVLATERLLGEVGAISEEHPSTRLGDVADYIRGLTYGKGDEAELPTPNAVLRAQNVSVEESRLVLDDLRYLRSDFEGSVEKRLRADDILVCSSSGSKSHMGKVAFVASDLPFFFGGFMGVLRSRRELIEPRFLFRLLTSQYHKTFLAGLTEGANINNLKLTEYLEYEIPLPPLEEQRRIVAEIEGYQQVIDGARQILAAYRPRVEMDSDWPVVTLGEIVDELESGVSVNSTSRPIIDGEVGILKTSCVTSGNFEYQQHKAVLPDEMKRVRCPVRRNTIIISRMNTEALVGANAYVGSDYPRLFLPDRLWQTVISRRDVEVRYVQAVLASDICRSRISALSHGTSGSMKNISKPQLLSLEIPLPPLPEQRRIVAELDAEAAEVAAVRALIPRTEAKIQRVLARVWGTAA